MEIEITARSAKDMYRQLQAYQHLEPEEQYYLKVSAKLMCIILKEAIVGYEALQAKEDRIKELQSIIQERDKKIKELEALDLPEGIYDSFNQQIALLSLKLARAEKVIEVAKRVEDLLDLAIFDPSKSLKVETAKECQRQLNVALKEWNEGKE